jgi:hypothetical protein
MDKKILDEQRPGSDLHGLIERIAYFVWRGNPATPAESNWDTAKTIIQTLGWSQISSPEKYHHTLEWTADGIHKAKNTDQNTSWYLAQKHWAEELFNYYNEYKKPKLVA